MAESDHFQILRHGPKVWNTWREQNPSQVPNLDDVALSLSERQLGPINGGPVNLRAACMRRAFLRSAALSGAELEAADMSGTDLTYARLDGANLKAANLSSAILDGADFTGAILTDANLSGASLRHVQNLTQAQIKHSICDAATVLPAHLVRPTSPLEVVRKNAARLWKDRGLNSAPSLRAWKSGATLCVGGFALSALVWLADNEQPHQIALSAHDNAPTAVSRNSPDEVAVVGLKTDQLAPESKSEENSGLLPAAVRRIDSRTLVTIRSEPHAIALEPEPEAIGRVHAVIVKTTTQTKSPKHPADKGKGLRTDVPQPSSEAKLSAGATTEKATLTATTSGSLPPSVVTAPLPYSVEQQIIEIESARRDVRSRR